MNNNFLKTYRDYGLTSIFFRFDNFSFAIPQFYTSFQAMYSTYTGSPLLKYQGFPSLEALSFTSEDF